MRIKHVMLAAAVVLRMTTGQGEAQETGQASHGLALAQRLCAECHAIEKRYARSPNANAPRFQAIASTPGMTAIALAAGRHHRLYFEPEMTLGRIPFLNDIQEPEFWCA
jgi:mono/diheme cytochrome c family protein